MIADYLKALPGFIRIVPWPYSESGFLATSCSASGSEEDVFAARHYLDDMIEDYWFSRRRASC